MTDSPPDRLSVDPESPHFDAACLKRGVGVRINGRERKDVIEYCLTEGWIKVQAGKTLDRKGKPFLVKVNGQVEAWFLSEAA